MYWKSVNEVLKAQYGCKVYKLAMSSGCSCPNRDGTLGTGGCIFCDGSSAFAAQGPIPQQLEIARQRVSSKLKQPAQYIAYFQSFTNTYAPADRLRPLFLSALEPEYVVGLSVATRPDCLKPDVLELLAECGRVKPVWVELGLQTIHPASVEFIRRGYENQVFDWAVRALKEINLTVIAHQILGLPGETTDMMAETARYIGHSGADGIKFHLLHVVKGTGLAEEWSAGHITVMDMHEYIKALEVCVESVPRSMVIHRLTGDGAKRDLLAPLWSGDKKRVLNAIHKAFLDDDVEQGRLFF